MYRFLYMVVYGVFSLLCFSVAGYAFYYLFQQFIPGNDFLSKFAEYNLAVPGHFFASGLSLLLVPFQLSRWLRLKYLGLHRLLGWLYVFCVVIGGISGFILAFSATGGWIAVSGFIVLSILWLLTTAMAIRYAILKNIQLHKKWIYRSVALTCGAITLRILLLVGYGIFNWPFLTVYVAAAWLSWILNLLLCELFQSLRNCKRHSAKSFA